jgi:Malectin domain
MHAAAQLTQERHELQEILASGIFNRAPNLAQVLTYVCEKYFEGAAEQIKEYNIAVEALGRPPEFDQKRDSIVRVEAHRLRKRLREYYEAEGAGHAVRIEIPSGQYAPKFQRQRWPDGVMAAPASRSDEPAVEERAAEDPAAEDPIRQVVPLLETQAIAPLPKPVALPPPPLPIPGPTRSRNGIFLILAVTALCASAVLLWRAPARTAARSIPAPVTGAATNRTEVRILAGLKKAVYTDRFGRVWEGDRWFNGGSVFESSSRPIIGARDSGLYQARREGAFSYDIPLPPGTYEMRLHFAETLYGENNMAGGGETSRIFTVLANGTEILHQFDIIGEVGASAEDIRAFKDISPAADGKLHLKFEPVTNPAIVSGIEITAGNRGQMRPIRMVSRDHPYTDREGRIWESDRYSRGGQLVQRTEPIANAEDPDLLRGERYGNLRYVIPVPRGRYGVTLYFAEAWFGPGKFAGGGMGSRMFDILANGVALRRGFDIFKEAHASDRAVAFTTHGLEPDAQGKLTISLVPLRNYACLNAIEVVDESR